MSWEKITFGELYKSPTRNGIYKEKSNHGSGVKIVNMGEIFAYDFIGSQDMQRIELTENELQNFRLEENDLLFARRSLVESGAGKASIVANLVEPTTFESSIIRVRLNAEICCPLFYLYWLRSLAGRAAISALVTGVNVKGIRGSELKDIKVDYPPIEIQRKISGILKEYDNLIENNQKQIQLLEEAAQRLYKEWFVDLRFPGHETTPIVDGVPHGWSIVCLDDVICKIATGLNPRKNFVLGQGTNYYVTIKNMSNNNVFLDEKCDFVDDTAIERINQRSDLKIGDLLFSGIGTIGRVYLIDIPTNNWNISESVFTMRANDRVSKEFLYLLLLSKDMQSYCDNNAHGAAQKGIRMADLRAYKFMLPCKYHLDEFTSKIKPIIDAAQVCRKKVKILTEARDRLLPKLMSGELEV